MAKYEFKAGQETWWTLAIAALTGLLGTAISLQAQGAVDPKVIAAAFGIGVFRPVMAVVWNLIQGPGSNSVTPPYLGSNP